MYLFLLGGGTITPEHKLMNEIRLYCGQHGWAVIRANVGKFLLADGRFFDTGLPKGWPDLMVLIPGGTMVFVETKIKPRKPTNEQKLRLKWLNDMNFKAFVCYELKTFINETYEYL